MSKEQQWLKMWQQVTSRPMTTREVKFAALVAAAEREECAKVCENMAGKPSWDAYQHYLDAAAAIRARGNT